jgi:hypothetical protein
MPLVLRSGVVAKPSAHDPITAPQVARSLAERDPELGAALEVMPFASSEPACLDALLEADCIVATGSDATVASVAARVAPPRRLLSYGHRLSLAAIGPQATKGTLLDETTRALALDISLWDQLGCLSPVAVFVAGDPVGADRVAESLARALDAAQVRWPRGRIDAETAAAIAREREEAEFRGAAGRPVRLHCGPGTTWTVVREEDAAPRPAPLHRFVRVHPVEGASALVDAIRPLGPHLAGVALCGFEGTQPALARDLAELGASRLCPPGALQTPPLGWHHDNRGVLPPLARFADLELS